MSSVTAVLDLTGLFDDLEPFRWPWGREEELDNVQLLETRTLRRLRVIAEQNHRVEHLLRRLLMNQADFDAQLAEIGVDTDKIGEAGQEILAEIAALQGQGVDTSGIVSAVQKLDDAVGGLASIAPPATPAQPVAAEANPLPPSDQTPGGASTSTGGDAVGTGPTASPDGSGSPEPAAAAGSVTGSPDQSFAQNSVDGQAPFVVKLDGESYDSYVERAQVAGVTPLDESAWNDVAAGSFA